MIIGNRYLIIMFRKYVSKMTDNKRTINVAIQLARFMVFKASVLFKGGSGRRKELCRAVSQLPL